MKSLISVFDKTGIIPFAQELHKFGYEIISTGGTAELLRSNGLSIKDISEHTDFPEMMDGRVKTLHPKVHGGLLGVRDNPAHQVSMAAHDIDPIDILVVNLYPFQETVAGGASFADCVENIDIGGPAMIRSAAKNHRFVCVITDPSDYQTIIDALANGGITPELRLAMARKAFALTASYDAAISSWLADEELPAKLTISYSRKEILRYGENPHQNAAFYVAHNAPSGTIAGARQLQGKELSYNNIADSDAALDLVKEFDKPAIAIIKHANPCGVAVADSLSEAYLKAFACDKVSAYGGIIAANREFDLATAEAMGKLFAEVIIAPSFSNEVREYFATRKNLRLLEVGELRKNKQKHIKSISGGLLVQTADDMSPASMELVIVSKRQPSHDEMRDLLFAFQVCKHVKSNAIVLAHDGASVGIGAGQMSRIDSTRIASWKMRESSVILSAAKDLPAAGDPSATPQDDIGLVLASDAFFPFADNVEEAAKAGVRAIIQPGGSIRDEEVIAMADKFDMAMVFTGVRHFRH